MVGTTKPTIQQIRDRSHWNSNNLVAQDPVTLGLCSQIDLDAEVKKAARRVDRERKEQGLPPLERAGTTLLPAEQTTAHAGAETAAEQSPQERKQTEDEEAARMLERLKGLGGEKLEQQAEEEAHD